jgi:hypothetical protein
VISVSRSVVTRWSRAAAGQAAGPGDVQMLRSSGRPVIRDRLREQICAGYLADFTARMDGENAALRAELVGALLLGMGVMRSLVGSPALSEATFEETRALVARLVATLTEPPPD